jgi:hypothetical protein
MASMMGGSRADQTGQGDNERGSCRLSHRAADATVWFRRHASARMIRWHTPGCAAKQAHFPWSSSNARRDHRPLSSLRNFISPNVPDVADLATGMVVNPVRLGRGRSALLDLDVFPYAGAVPTAG